MLVQLYWSLRRPLIYSGVVDYFLLGAELISTRRPTSDIADLHYLVDTLTELAWAMSERDRNIQFTMMDGTHHVGRVTLVDSGPLERGPNPPYYATMTVEFADGCDQTFDLLDVSVLAPHSTK